MDKSENRTLIVKVICVLLSFGLWFYVSTVENPLRTYELKNIPVELTNENSLADAKFAISNKQQFTVDLKLEGPSSEVVKVKKEDFKIVADMSAYALKNGENAIPVEIVSSPEDIEIKNNGFLGIKVNLEDVVQKEFTIESKVKLSYTQHVYEQEQTINPKTVTVTGGKSSVERINAAILSGEEKDIDKNKESEYGIKFVDSSGNEVDNVESDDKTANLSIVVINGKVIPINLKTTGAIPQGFILEGYELSKNNINIFGDSETLDTIQSIDTQFVDMSSIQVGSEVDVKLNLPEGISVQDEDNTIKVKFNVKKEETTTKNLVCDVQYKNLDETLSLDPSNLTTNLTANVTLIGTQAALDKISTENINVVVDLLNVKEEGTSEYTPQATLTNGNDVTISAVGNVNIVVKKKS